MVLLKLSFAWASWLSKMGFAVYYGMCSLAQTKCIMGKKHNDEKDKLSKREADAMMRYVGLGDDLEELAREIETQPVREFVFPPMSAERQAELLELFRSPEKNRTLR